MSSNQFHTMQDINPQRPVRFFTASETLPTVFHKYSVFLGFVVEESWCSGWVLHCLRIQKFNAETNKTMIYNLDKICILFQHSDFTPEVRKWKCSYVVKTNKKKTKKTHVNVLIRFGWNDIHAQHLTKLEKLMGWDEPKHDLMRKNKELYDLYFSKKCLLFTGALHV